MTTRTISKTSTEIASGLQQYSWVLMDEEQKDILMRDYVLPNYMEVASDGVKMGPTWWAALLGATVSAIESRVRRLRAKGSEVSEEASSTPRNNVAKALSDAPYIVGKMTKEQKLAITEQLANDPDVIDTVEGRQTLVSGVGRSNAREDVREAKGRSTTGGEKVANEAGVFAGATHLLTAYSGLKKFNEWASDMDERDIALTNEQKGELSEMMPSINTELDIAKLKIL